MKVDARVLVAGCGGSRYERLSEALSSRGHRTATATLEEIETLPAPPHEVVLVLGEDAIEGCRRLTARVPTVAVIVMDETPELSRAIGALRAGAADYVPRPGDLDAVDTAIRRVIERRELADRLGRLGSEVVLSDSEPQLIGESEAIRQVRDRIDRLKTSDATVLVTGESGTGKEVAARLLHYQSARRAGPFIAVNCGAVPSRLVESEFFGHARGAFTDAGSAKAGLLVQASGGTLFLDEVGTMPLPAQAKLLRAIQERAARPLGHGSEIPFDVRIIAATHVDLTQQVSLGLFRQDLLFRLNVVPIRMPPLRDRGTDTLLLAHHFIRRFAALSAKRVVGMTLGAARALTSYYWPGNVRELSNWMEAAVALARHDHVTEAELLSNLRGPSTGKTTEDATASGAPPASLECWNDLEASHIAAVLEDVGGNKARAARLLGIDRKTLYRKLRRRTTPPAGHDSSRPPGAD